MVFHWSLSDSKSPQVCRTRLSILAVLSNADVWFTIYNQKLMDLLGEINTYEQISQQTVSNNINDFNKSYRKLISNGHNIINQLPPHIL